MNALHHGSHPCACDIAAQAPKLVAITGGPGAGKTAVIEMALRALCTHVVALPESASIVFGGGFPRRSTLIGRAAAQRAIFRVQRELECLVGEEQVAVALCDRGTVDGYAYWPDEQGAYWESLDTTREAEIARYDAIIHLRTPSPERGYNHDYHLRIESAEEARSIDDRILAAWDGHPHRVVIDSTDHFLEKARWAIEAIAAEMPECCTSNGGPPGE